jgi:lipoyl(octanoyl) transferase
VETLTCRLLPYACADGPHNMAADEALLQTATTGIASIRFYGWSEPTVSLGYFQPARVRLEDPNLASLAFVRRPSGGATLVHHHELTYCLALPPGAWQHGEPWLTRMHRIIAAALLDLGVRTGMHEGQAQNHGSNLLCFRQFTPGDLLIDSAKVVGSAQRKRRGALLQHGAIILARSQHTPSLPGIREVTSLSLSPAQAMAAVIESFETLLNAQTVAEPWTHTEQNVAAQRLTACYRQDAWNNRR